MDIRENRFAKEAKQREPAHSKTMCSENLWVSYRDRTRGEARQTKSSRQHTAFTYGPGEIKHCGCGGEEEWAGKGFFKRTRDVDGGKGLEGFLGIGGNRNWRCDGRKRPKWPGARDQGPRGRSGGGM